MDICDLRNPQETMDELYKHRTSSTAISRIDWSPVSKILVSADYSSRFRAMRIGLSTSVEGKWETQCILDEQLGQGAPINQVLLSPDGTMLLVSSLHMDQLWNLQKTVKVSEVEHAGRKQSKWFQHSTPKWDLVLYEDGAVACYNWMSLREVATCTSDDQDDQNNGVVDLESMVLDPKQDVLVFKREDPRKRRLPKHEQSTPIFAIDLSSITAVREEESSLRTIRPPNLFADVPDLDQIIGNIPLYASSSLIYVTGSGWVCSIELSDEVPESFQRHFFIPSVWLSKTSALIATVMENHDIVVIHDGEIAVFECGFLSVEDVSL